MEWLSGNNRVTGRASDAPLHPAVKVKIYMHHKDGQRVDLSLNAALVKQMRLQPGDRLAIGIDTATGTIGLRRSQTGRAISGNGFSIKRDGTSEKGGHSTPHVSFGCKAFPGIYEWALPLVKQWIPMRDRGAFFESTDNGFYDAEAVVDFAKTMTQKSRA